MTMLLMRRQEEKMEDCLAVVRPMEVDQLRQMLDDEGRRRRSSPILLVIDSRSFLAFNAGHILTAHNVHCPPIVRRRCSGATIPIENIVRCPDSRERLLTGQYSAIVVYDDSTTGSSDGGRGPLSVNVAPEQERRLLVDRSGILAEDTPKNDLCLVLESLCCHLLSRNLTLSNVFYLNGGFDRFSNLRQHIVSSEIISSANTITMTSTSSSSSSSSDVCVSSVTNVIGISAQDISKALRSTNRRQQITEIFGGQQKTLKAFDTVKWHSSKDKGDPTEILPWLYLGNAYHAHQEDRLRKLEILALLNVAEDSSVPVSPLPTDVFCHMNLPIADSSTSDIRGKFPQAIEFIENVRLSGGKVLVHCLAGISRSPAICMAYLMYSLHLSLDDAHDYLKAKRHLISPNLNFMRQLAEFENLLSSSSDRLREPVVARCAPLGHGLTKLLQSGPPESTPPPSSSSSHSSHVIDISKMAMLPPPPLGVGPAEERSLSRKRPRPTSLSFTVPSSSSSSSSSSSTTCSVPMTPCTKQAGFGFDFSAVAAGLKLSPTVSHSPLLSPI